MYNVNVLYKKYLKKFSGFRKQQSQKYTQLFKMRFSFNTL